MLDLQFSPERARVCQKPADGACLARGAAFYFKKTASCFTPVINVPFKYIRDTLHIFNVTYLKYSCAFLVSKADGVLLRGGTSC